MSLLLGFIFSHDSKDTVGHGIIHGMAFGLGVNHEMTFGLEVTTRVFGLIIQAVLTICCFHCVFCVFGTQSQHTPVIHGWSKSWINAHKIVPKYAEWRTLKRLGEEIGQHMPSGAIPNGHLSILDTVSDTEVANVDVSGSFATGVPAIFLKKDSALIVLVNN